MRLIQNAIVLLGLFSGGCGALSLWNRLPSQDANLGAEIVIAGYADAAPSPTNPHNWKYCVVLVNNGPAAQLVFRNYLGEKWIADPVFDIGAGVGVRIGHEDVAFMFYGIGHSAPALIAPANAGEKFYCDKIRSNFPNIPPEHAPL